VAGGVCVGGGGDNGAALAGRFNVSEMYFRGRRLPSNGRKTKEQKNYATADAPNLIREGLKESLGGRSSRGPRGS
jgi:hypothetical protein